MRIQLFLKNAFASFGLSHTWNNASSICFPDLLAQRFSSFKHFKAMKIRRFCTSRKRKMKRDEKKLISITFRYLCVEDKGMKMKMITWGVRTWPAKGWKSWNNIFTPNNGWGVLEVNEPSSSPTKSTCQWEGQTKIKLQSLFPRSPDSVSWMRYFSIKAHQRPTEE